ncbi:transposase [Chitinolyticbacter meiyuanensis]|uniref:transposase n=1 Tax=Chitinolyticbacter meiyuanensis TaxID=682798 RepID=UPI001651E8A5|nr:transposase [Chitinolyticbacter meiyuanensis]
MEWVADLTNEGDTVVARIVKDSGEVETVPLKDLHLRGVPDLTPDFTQRLRVDFRDFTPVNPTPELAKLGVQMPALLANKHFAYELDVDGVRLIVPALALMREFFNPSRYFLYDALMPQVLDRVCWLKHGESGVQAVFCAPWATDARARKLYNCERNLEWMALYPSGRRLANSVHHNASSGCLQLSLPAAGVDMIFRGVIIEGAVFVTSVALMTMDIEEEPLFEVERPLKKLMFRSRSVQKSASKLDIPCHPDGTVAVTPCEWNEICHLIFVPRGPEAQLDQRLVLDGILRKFHCGTGWRASTYGEGSWWNASSLYRQWKVAGVFENIMDVLRRSRPADSNS